ncbi:MAG TPA: hypothetical protein VGG99_14790 [Acetobacteraceae bacterium]|jgi:hypothetical protein
MKPALAIRAEPAAAVPGRDRSPQHPFRAQFPVEIPCSPRRLAERFFNVRQWTVMPRGSRCAAWGQPAVLSDDVREFFPMLRQEFVIASGEVTKQSRARLTRGYRIVRPETASSPRCSQ